MNVPKTIREKAIRTFLRFETAPAEQMQYEWTEYRVNIGETTVAAQFIVDATVKHPQYNSAFLSFCVFYGRLVKRSVFV